MSGAAAAAPPARLGGLLAIADDDPRWPQGPVAQARAACDGGAALVQLRAKHASDRRVLEWAEAVRAATRAAGALFFVNDRFDLALAAEADGVHLGQDDLPPGRLPAAARGRLLVGRSTHDRAQAEAAREEGVDYVAFGPVFGTASKESPYGPRGLEALAEVVRLVAPRPVFAIGGVDLERAGRAVAAGAAGVAVISAIAAADAPEAAARALAEAATAGAA